MSVESKDIETNCMIANFKSVDIYKKYMKYIYETGPSTKHVAMKQNCLLIFVSYSNNTKTKILICKLFSYKSYIYIYIYIYIRTRFGIK